MIAVDINEVFRGGGRSVEFLDRINQASIVMLDETGIVPHAVARRIAGGIAAAGRLRLGCGSGSDHAKPLSLRYFHSRKGCHSALEGYSSCQLSVVSSQLVACSTIGARSAPYSLYVESPPEAPRESIGALIARCAAVLNYEMVEQKYAEGNGQPALPYILAALRLRRERRRPRRWLVTGDWC